MSETPNEEAESALFKLWDFPETVTTVYCNQHMCGHTPKEIQLIFGQTVMPNRKATASVKILMTERHAIELVHNLQKQINLFIKQHKDESDEPPKRR